MVRSAALADAGTRPLIAVEATTAPTVTHDEFDRALTAAA
jgi:hypothetical protein